MFKNIFAVLFCVLAALIFCSCGGKQEKKKNFVVGFDAGFPPYGYMENGEYKGFDLDLAREVARRNGWKLVLRPINWDVKDLELNSGAIDCIWNGFTINGRENSYTWSEPYVDNGQVVLVRKSSGIRTLADLAGRKVAAQADTPVLKALSPGGEKEFMGKTFRQLFVTPDYNNAVMELESGAVDAVAMDIGIAKKKERENAAFVILEEMIMTEQYGIGFRKGNTELRDAVQKTLKEMVSDGTAAEIAAEYSDGEIVLILKP